MSQTPPPRRTVVDRLAQNPGLVLAALVFTVVAGVVAVAAFGLDVFDRVESRSGPPAGSSSTSLPPLSTTSTTSGPNSTPPSGAPDTAASTCLDGAGEPIDCREPHQYERYSGDCSTPGMLRFMAGRPGLDVVLASVVRDGGGCLLSTPVTVADSAAQALSGTGDDAWLRCVDERESRLVSCDRPHTGEYVATGRAGKADLDECRAAAEVYMDQSLGSVGDLLQVHVVDEIDDDPNSARCLIAIRGSQPLDASVRNLGVSPVPIER